MPPCGRQGTGPALLCSSLLSGLPLGPALLCRSDEEQGPFSCMLWPVKGGASSVHTLGIIMVSGNSLDQGCPHAFDGNMGHGHRHTLLLHTHETRHGPQGQHRTGLHHDLRRRIRLLTIACFSPPSYLQICLYSAQAVRLLFLSRLFIPYLYILVIYAVDGNIMAGHWLSSNVCPTLRFQRKEIPGPS